LARIERLEGGVDAVAGQRDVAPAQPRGPVAVADAVQPTAPLPTSRPADDPSASAVSQAASTSPRPASTPSQPVSTPTAHAEVSVASIAAIPTREQSSAQLPGEQPASEAEAAVSLAEGLAPLLAWWPAVVDLVRTDNALLGACIEEARPVEVTGEDLTVAFSATAPFLKKKAENPDNRAAVTAALKDITGRRWRLSYELQDELDSDDDAAPATGSEEEWLKRFMDEFDAEELPSEALTSEEKGV
jgi:hypothetical protein